MINKNYNVIGVMSGTSLDGIDMTYVNFQKNKFWEYKILFAKTFKYDDLWKNKLECSQDLNGNKLN